MPSLAHNSNEFWDNFLGIGAHFQTSEWSFSDEYIFYALLKILIWEEAERPAGKAYLLSTADRQLKYAAKDIEESSSVRRDTLVRLHERLPLIIDTVLRTYWEDFQFNCTHHKLKLSTDLKTTLAKTLLKGRDELVSPPWKDLLINVEFCAGKVVMGIDIEDKSLLYSTDSKTEEKMKIIDERTFWDKIDLWGNFIWDIWYPFTDRFLGVSRSFELREYEYVAGRKYLEVYVARLIHYFVDFTYSYSEMNAFCLACAIVLNLRRSIWLESVINLSSFRKNCLMTTA